MKEIAPIAANDDETVSDPTTTLSELARLLEIDEDVLLRRLAKIMSVRTMKQ